VAFPIANSQPAEESAIRLSAAGIPGTTFSYSTVTDDCRGARSAVRKNSPVLGQIEPFSSEHRVDCFAEAAFHGERDRSTVSSVVRFVE